MQTTNNITIIMSRGSKKLHDSLVQSYINPTNDMLKEIGLRTENILTKHYELPLSYLFSSYGCYSNKTPDIIYSVDRDGGRFFYVGEIKSGGSLKTKAKASKKAMIYSKILDDYAIPHHPFIVTGYEREALPAEQIYKDFVKKGYYKKLKKRYHNKQKHI